ncbi:MAG TPA: hypothetical protein VFF30_01925 [Nitrososphaerales archaeon]|nr:hypothetical protein [Nitrososphaerales archaeon]
MVREKTVTTQREYIDIRSLKARISEILPSASILRAVLIGEPDVLSPRDFIAKLGTWLDILEEEEY